MIARLRSIRFTWTQIAVIAAASAFATVVIIDVNSRSHHLSPSMLAALRERVAVRTVARTTPAPAVQAATPANGGGTTSVAPDQAASSATAFDGSLAASAPTDTATSGSATPGSDTSGSDASGSDMSGTDISGTSTATATTPASAVSPVKHVFVIALTTTSYRAAFGPGSVARYLNGTLRRRGTLLSGYRTLGGSELPDYLAMVSGQAPNADTRKDCATYSEFPSATTPRTNGQVPGSGCVYPNTVLTIADQVTAAGKQWRAYLADMGSEPCMHPNSNAADDAPVNGAGIDYATRHNPFIYFHSLLDLGGCSSDDVGLTHLAGALRTNARTPSYAFIAPGLCDEPSASPCPPTEPTGLAGEDKFLKQVIPPILRSAAYKQDGVVIIAFARAPAAAGSAPMRSGALILSPLAKTGSTLRGTYNPYSVLRSVEDLFGYTPLVHAKSAPSFATAALPGA